MDACYIIVILDCEWGEWSPAQNCSKPCGGGVWRLSRQIISPDPYCKLDSQGQESWKVEHCHAHTCPATLAAWLLTPLATFLLVGLAVFFYKRGYTRMQTGVPLRTFPTSTNY